MRHFLIAVTAGVCLAAGVVHAAHTRVQLFLSAGTVRPGDTIWAGMDLKMDAGWHTYWKNSGVAGLPTKIEWTLPAGVTAGEVLWPLPQVIPPAEVTTYGYENEVMLLVPLVFATNSQPGPVVLKANVSWLECQDQCVPGSTKVEATINVGSDTTRSTDAATIESWRSKVPIAGGSLPFRAAWENPPASDTRPLLLEFSPPANTKLSQITAANFFPDASDNFEIQAATETISNPSAGFVIRKLVKKFSGDWPNAINGVMVIEHDGRRYGYEVSLPVSDQAAAIAGTAVNTAGQTFTIPAAPKPSIIRMLLYAFIGGLILNIMPCVLPVIALKILGFVSEAKSEPGHVRKLGVFYTFGVMTSFAVLGGVVVAVKLAGHQAAWGMQFGNPVFLVALATLVTLVALNLFGVFEVTLASGAMNVASNLSTKSGLSGAFFNGALATALATPCSAPILGSALAFAFTQPVSTLMLIFLTIGLGLASPYLVLSWNPAWLKFLPRPGAWMEKFKIAMGFPMLAAVLWLYNIATATYGKNVLWLGVFLVFMSAAAWTFGNFVQRGRGRKRIAFAVVLILLAGGYGYALEKELNWRHPVIETATSGSLKESAEGIDWQPWSAAAVAQARAAGKTVLVDFTADWCLTCQVNKKTSIEITSVREKIKSLGAVALLADYTHTPDVITAELSRYHRAGVPLVLVYPKNADAPPIVLPEVLTPGIVLNAIAQTAQ